MPAGTLKRRSRSPAAPGPCTVPHAGRPSAGRRPETGAAREGRVQAAAAIARSLTAGLKPAEILGVIRDQTRPIIGGDCWALARLDREGQAWEVMAVGVQSDGGPESGGRVPLDHPLLAPILEAPGAPVFGCRNSNPGAGNRVLPFPVAAASLTVLPLMAGGHLAGALVLGHSAGNSLDGSDRDFLRLAADQAALALENARLWEQVRASRARLDSRKVALEHQLKRLTLTDDLTGLHNQRDLFEQLPREMERAKRARQRLFPVSVRPGWIQGIQRHPRPPGGGSPASDRGSRRFPDHSGQDGPGLSLRRRRVRAAAAPHPSGRSPGPGGPAAPCRLPSPGRCGRIQRRNRGVLSRDGEQGLH